ncbi:MAG: hypothetical protein A4E47_00486 [Methanosaeta sp. PtaU1.Bin028]|nr:MAG: hypothetical protein A4E47_00486 [Methanosaeta sp. PtaU1.Bin028]
MSRIVPWLILSLLLLPAANCQMDKAGTDAPNATVKEALFFTTIYLDLERAVVEMPVNGTGYNLTTAIEAKNISLTEGNRPVNLSIEAEYWRGVHTYRLNFNRTENAILRFEIAATGQQFISPVLTDGPLRVVLPAGYATGNRLMGIARPPPDRIETLARPEGNRTALIWASAPARQVEVDFYSERAPRALLISMALLAVLALMVAVDYILAIRRMRDVRDGEEMIWLRGRRGRHRG